MFVDDRLTDDRTAKSIADNARGLIDADRDPDLSDLRYIRLAQFENNTAEIEWEYYDDVRELWVAVCGGCHQEMESPTKIGGSYKFCYHCGRRLIDNGVG